MRVVIGANSLTGQLTGIGHYTKSLVEGLSSLDEIAELRLLSHGRLGEPITPGWQLRSTAENSEKPESSPSFAGRLRPIASRSRALVELYDIATSVAAKFSLRHYSHKDIFHSPDFQFAPFPGKTVVTIPDLSTITYPEFHPASRVAYINRHIRRAVDRADHIVAISDFVKREINEKLKVPIEKITTIYPGVDPEFAPIDRESFEDAGINPALKYKSYFIFVSTIEPRKNLHNLLEAYQRYIEIEKESAFPLVVVGLPGWHSADIHKKLTGLAETRHVIYLGYVDRSKLRLMLAGARALLFPSLYEGFGLPVVESMKSGTAVLTSIDSAMAEVAADSALLIDPLDTDQLCESVLRLQRDSALVDQLVHSGLETINEFSWRNCANRTVRLYKSL